MRNRSSSELVLLERVDIEVNRGVGGGQQVTEAGHVGQPARPLSQNLGDFLSFQSLVYFDCVSSTQCNT